MSKSTAPGQQGKRTGAAAPKGPKPDAGPGTDRDTAREKVAQNDRAAKNQSGMGSNPSARDVTSGRRSGNQ